MKHGPLIFLGVFFTLATSWCGLIFAPQLQLGSQQPVRIEATGQLYPSARPGLAQQGAEVYRANGCVYCHSQQVRQSDSEFDLILAPLPEAKVEPAAFKPEDFLKAATNYLAEANLLKGDAQGYALARSAKGFALGGDLKQALAIANQLVGYWKAIGLSGIYPSLVQVGDAPQAEAAITQALTAAKPLSGDEKVGALIEIAIGYALAGDAQHALLVAENTQSRDRVYAAIIKALAKAGKTEAGKAKLAVTMAVFEIKGGRWDDAEKLVATAPKPILKGVSKKIADAARSKIEAAGGKANASVIPLGHDLERGWGKRPSVAQDFLYDYPVQIGSQRIGPDLADVGARDPKDFALAWKFQSTTTQLEEATAWHLLHLYNPQAVAVGTPSTMPPYRFLFEKRDVKTQPSWKEPKPEDLLNQLRLAGKFSPANGVEVAPKNEARALVAYLLSLQSETPLLEAPTAKLLLPAVASTNAPAASGTNAPAVK